MPEATRERSAAPTTAAVSRINVTRFDANGPASDGSPEVWHAITAKTRRNANEVDGSAWCVNSASFTLRASYACIQITVEGHGFLDSLRERETISEP